MNIWELDAKTFADTLRERRKDMCLTQGELAKRAGVNLVTIVNYENDYHIPELATLIKVASALGIDEIRISTKVRWGW